MYFNEIVGNENNKIILTNAIKNGNILHSYLFYGIDGIGKKCIAEAFAKAILCEDKENGKACGKCKSCKGFETKNNPDFFTILPDGNSIKIEQIRQMQKSMMEKPIESNKKVYIIDNAHTMTKEAQNCMLKTLEEPQEYIVIIIISADENSILPTIKSRCTKIYFNKLTDEEIIKYISKKYDDLKLEDTMIKLSNGSIAKINEIVSKVEILKNIEKLIENIQESTKLEFILNNEILYDNKENIEIIMDYMCVLLHNKVIKNVLNSNRYANAVKIVQNAKNKLLNSNNYDMTIDNMLMKIWEEINEKNYRC